MNVALAFTLAAAILAAFIGGLGRRLSQAPLWGDLERAWPLGAVTSAFAFLEVARFLDGPVWLLGVVSRLQFSVGLLMTYAWLRYTAVVLDGTPARGERRLGLAVLAAMLLALFPGVAVDVERLHTYADPVLGGIWRDFPLAPLGHALFLAGLALTLWVLARLVAGWRRGTAAGGPMALAFAFSLPVAAFDYLVRADLVAGPHVIALAAVLPVTILGWRAGVRFVGDANALHELRGRLEALVEERTRDLAETHAALLQAEKLAALGQFAAGVAHEVNNPASVATANLAELSRTLGIGLPPEETRELVDESLDAMRRINELVRKLLDAGRLADLPPGTGNVELAAAVELALSELRARARLDVELLNRVPDDLLVRGGDEVVGRILAALLANAVEAIPTDRKGHVQVSARADGGVVRLVIEDDGCGMAEDRMRRAFDPFFTTKAEGRGNGLGLPVTRGLVEGIGGEIWLESEPGGGTRAAVELPAGHPA